MHVFDEKDANKASVLVFGVFIRLCLNSIQTEIESII